MLPHVASATEAGTLNELGYILASEAKAVTAQIIKSFLPEGEIHSPAWLEYIINSQIINITFYIDQ